MTEIPPASLGPLPLPFSFVHHNCSRFSIYRCRFRFCRCRAKVYEGFQKYFFYIFEADPLTIPPMTILLYVSLSFFKGGWAILM